MIYSDGTVKWGLSGRFETYCSLNMEWYPFDTQECNISIGSPARPTRYINMSALAGNVAKTFSVSNDEFEVSFMEPSMHHDYYKGEEFSTCHFPVFLRRRYMYYVVNILNPVTLLSLMSLAPFALPVDSGERVSLLITAFLALSVYELILTEHVPITSLHIPVLSKWNINWIYEIRRSFETFIDKIKQQRCDIKLLCLL